MPGVFLDNYAKNKFAINAEGMFANSMLLGIQGFSLTALAIYFNCSPFWISIAFTLPLACQIFQIFLGCFYKLFKTRKTALLVSACLSRLPIIIIPIAAFFNLRSYKILIFVMFMYGIFASFTSGIWTSSVGDIIKKEDRSRFFSKRFFLLTLTTIIFSYVYSEVLGFEDQRLGIITLGIFSSIAAIITIVLFFLHDIPDFKSGTPSFDLKIPLRDAHFKRYLAFIGVFNFTIEFSKPYFNYFVIKNFDVSYSYLGNMAIVTGIGSMLLFPIYGFISTRIGNKKLVSYGITISTYIVMFYVLMSPQNYKSLLFFDAIGTALGWSAINLCLFNLLLEVVKEPKDSYVSCYYIVVGGMGLFGALFGGVIADFVSGKTFSIFGDEYLGLQIIFFISIILRLYATLLLTRVSAYQRNVHYPGIVPLVYTFFNNKR